MKEEESQVQLFQLQNDQGGSSKDLKELIEINEGSQKACPGAKWVTCSYGEYPNNAVISKQTRSSTIIVARAPWNGSGGTIILPGYFWWNYSKAYVSYRDSVQNCNPYEILTAPPGSLAWVPVEDGELLNNAVVGGKAEENTAFFIGRRKLKEQYGTRGACGKVDPLKKKCLFPIVRENFPFLTFEWSSTMYDMLVAIPEGGLSSLPKGSRVAGSIIKEEYDPTSVWGVLDRVRIKVNMAMYVIRDKIEHICSRTFMRYYFEPWYFIVDSMAPWKILILWACWMCLGTGAGARYWFIFWFLTLHSYWAVMALIIFWA